MAGRLILGGIPLGNVGDASARLAEALTTAEIVAAEDTRRLRRLATELGVEIGGRVVSYFEGNEIARTPELVAELTAGATVLLVTDGGMPSVSDPGYRLVAAVTDPTAAAENDIEVTVLPGPSAVTAALAVSGMPCDRFCFEGFPPRKPSERRRAYAALAGETRTIVLFESPHRIAESLIDLAAALGPDRPAALCRELTKTYEQVVRGTLADLVTLAADGVRGEITLVVSGVRADPDSAGSKGESTADLAAAVATTEAAGIDRKAAIAAVAAVTGTRKRVVYDAVLAAKGRK